MVEIANKLYDNRNRLVEVSFKDGSRLKCTPLQGIFDDDENGEYVVMYYSVILEGENRRDEIDIVDIESVIAID